MESHSTSFHVRLLAAPCTTKHHQDDAMVFKNLRGKKALNGLDKFIITKYIPREKKLLLLSHYHIKVLRVVLKKPLTLSEIPMLSYGEMSATALKSRDNNKPILTTCAEAKAHSPPFLL